MHVSDFESKGYIQRSYDHPQYDRMIASYNLSQNLCQWEDYSTSKIGFQYRRTQQSSDVVVSVLNTTYSIPNSFEELIEEINFSKELLDLKDNWDNDGAKPIDPAIYKATINLLINYTLFIWKSYNIAIKAPEINACSSGSIDLSWRTKNARLLINVKSKNGNITAIFYGDYNDNILPRQGVLDVESIDESVTTWMKVLI